MATGIEINRTSITLPTDVSAEVIQKTQEASAVMQLARPITLPGRGLTIPVITDDPSAAWVGETDNKPVSNPNLSQKVMRGYKLAVIVPFSNQFRRDLPALYNAIIERIPGVLGQKFDNTVFGGTAKPGSDFDNFASVNAHSISSDAYQGLVDCDTDIAMNGGITNGYVISPQGKGLLLAATDDNDRPLFINNISEGAVPMILGAKSQISKGAFISGSPNVVGFAGDWTKAMYGIVEGVDIQFSSDASLTLGDGTTINLFQRNMFAVRAEIEIGFVADTSVFTKITASTVPSF